MYWRKYIFERHYSNLNNLFQRHNLQYIYKVYWGEQGQYLMQLDALEKKCNGTAS